MIEQLLIQISLVNNLNYKKKFLSFLLFSTFLLVFTISISHLFVSAVDNDQFSKEKTSVEIGEIYRFKFETVKYDSKRTVLTLSSYENNYEDNYANITIEEGDTVKIEIRNVTESEYTNMDTISFWISVEGSNQEKIGLEMMSSFMFFGPSSEKSFYEEQVESIKNPEYEENIEMYESVETFVENDRFYALVHYNLEYEYASYNFLEMEVYIPKAIISFLELKLELNYTYYESLPSEIEIYDHLRIISLDYSPIYVKDAGFNLINFLKENIVGLVTEPFFYLILAEFGGLIILIMFLRGKGAF